MKSLSRVRDDIIYVTYSSDCMRRCFYGKTKVSIIGGGNTGATLAFIVAQQELADVVLIDRPTNEGQVKGKALDILESSSVYGFDVNVKGPLIILIQKIQIL